MAILSALYMNCISLDPSQVSDLTSYKRMKITRAIKKSVSDGERGGMIIRYYIKLPLNSTHTNHQLGEVRNSCACLIYNGNISNHIHLFILVLLSLKEL